MRDRITRETVDGITIKYLPRTSGMYAVSRDGHVYSFSTKMGGKEIGAKGPQGYITVSIYYDNGSLKTEYIHRLVAKMFLPKPPIEKCQVNHINDDRTDNRVENLEYCTPEENINSGNHNENLAAAIRSYYEKNGYGGRKPVRIAIYDNNKLLAIASSIKAAAVYIETITGKSANSNAVQISGIVAGKSGFKTVGGYNVLKVSEKEYRDWVAAHTHTVITDEEVDATDVRVGKTTKEDGVKVINRRLDMKTGELSCIVDEYGKGEKVENELH